jgi:hypothetical protein
MAAEVSDDIVRIFAACATYEGLPRLSRSVSVMLRTRSIWNSRPTHHPACNASS